MTLETERLILRPVEEGDARAVYVLRSDPDVTYNLLSDTRSEDESASWVARCRQSIDDKNGYPLAITLKEDGTVIGMCGLFRVSWEHLNAELVYWLGKEFWGKGYMTEAVRRIVQFGFEELGLERIQAGCFTRNPASRHVLEKAGFKYEGCARHQYRKDDEFLDEYRFGMTREDWRSDKGPATLRES